MYWWNIKALANELKANKVPQYEKFKYFFAFMLVDAILFEFVYLFPLQEGPKVLDYVDSLAIISITLLGIILCYKANKKGDNKEFIDRFICLSWPIGVRLFVIFIAVLIPYFIIADSVLGDSFMEETTIVDVMITVVFSSAFYIWIYKYILQISATKKGKKA